MKTPEDEAFDEIERRQGGFQAKRAMAADKLQEPAQKPVAHIRAHVLEVLQSYSEQCHSVLYRKPAKTRIPLYTAPPKREWVGLTDEDIGQWIEEEHDVLRWAEAKLKEKNT